MHVHFSEIFTLLMLIFTVGAPVTFLILSRRSHTTDDADISKYEVFTAGTSGSTSQAMPTPRHSYFGSSTAINTKWVWVTLSIGVLWLVIMLGMFISSFGFHAMRSTVAQ